MPSALEQDLDTAARFLHLETANEATSTGGGGGGWFDRATDERHDVRDLPRTVACKVGVHERQVQTALAPTLLFFRYYSERDSTSHTSAPRTLGFASGSMEY